MDFKDEIRKFSDRVEKLKVSIQTEEATKNAFIMPFIKVLGYDVFDPHEVVPEFIADIGIKKGEKVDYAILKDSKPVILVECKHWSENLDPHNSQLFRYFHTTSAKFGLLSNGIVYRFYTDLVEPNKMDERPFFEFDVTDIKDNQIEELKKFHKSYFDIGNIQNTASELKYMNELKTLIHGEFNAPSEAFVKHFAKQVYPGILTAKLFEQFSSLTKRSLNQYINDLITDRLKSALNKEESAAISTEAEVDSASVSTAEQSRIETTQDEIEAFLIVKSMLRQYLPAARIFYRDAQTYFAILLDDNNRKPICRLHLNGNKKYIGLFGDDKKESKVEISSLDDIYNHLEALKATAMSYDRSKVAS